jgi:hypothetical protein
MQAELCCLLVISSLLAAVAVFFVTPASAQPGSPGFSTLAATAGTVGDAFFVYLPLANTGTRTATNVQVTSLALGKAPLSLHQGGICGFDLRANG